MPEPVSIRLNFLPSPNQFAPTDNQTFAHHVQTLYKLAVPNTNIYQALTTELPLSNLLDTFQAASKEIDLWLEYANIAIFALELDVREGMSVKNVGEMDVLIHKFAPNVELLRELSQLILAQPKDSNDVMNQKDILDTVERINGEWLEAKAFFQKVKKEMSESKQRRELLDTMDQILLSIDELNTNIFEYQEQRHSGTIGAGSLDTNNSDAFPFSELSPRTRPITPATPIPGSNNELNSRSDVAALIQLDSRLEPLSARIEYLTSRLSAPSAPSDPIGTLAKKNKLLLNKWDALKQEMESLREELKEDRWLSVFKQVSSQANHMMDSLERVVRQCREFIARAMDPSESPLPLRQLQLRDIFIPPSYYNQQKSQQQQQQQQPIQPPVTISAKNFHRLFNSFEDRRKYYHPAITKMLTLLGNDINNGATKDMDVIKKYKSMKERWDNILEGIAEVKRDMPILDRMIEASHIPSNSPPSSIPSSIASSPPMSPSMRPFKTVFPPEFGSPPKQMRSVSPYRTSPLEYERASSPTRNNPKSPSPRALSPHGGRHDYLYGNGHGQSESPSPPFPDLRPPWNYNHSKQSYNALPYSPTYNNHYNNSPYLRSTSPPPPKYDRYERSKSHSRSGSPVRSPSAAAGAPTRPISPGDRTHPSAIPRPVTSMGLTGTRTGSRMGMRSLLPTSTTPNPGMMASMSRLSRKAPIRSRTPSSVASDASRPITPEEDDEEEEDPLSETLQSMKVKDHPPYIPAKNDPLDAEVAKIVNASPITVKVERIPGGKGKYYFGNNTSIQGRKIYLCRLVTYPSSGRNKVTVRVGGGWQDLDMFLLEHGLLKDIGVRAVF
ncbi:hypothetical protein G9A89_022436 [Geosiphon pyriformis]|nr:hypothetical protein G9A89_022436 [Geosiphon pyriformis]